MAVIESMIGIEIEIETGIEIDTMRETGNEEESEEGQEVGKTMMNSKLKVIGHKLSITDRKASTHYRRKKLK